MDSFQLYAKYYDLLNQDKDYESEVFYLKLLIDKYSVLKNKCILDLGCGTGKHAHLFTKLGYQVDGVDISEKMIEQAKGTYGSEGDLQFFQGNITDFKIDKKYDVITSLFHVISYQTKNKDLMNSFTTAYDHLNEGGLFIFDFWYGPGVLTDRPVKRIKTLENEMIKVKRRAIPEMLINESVVDVNYEISIKDKSANSKQIIKEKHAMRYFFINELAFYLESVGFALLQFFEWMTFEIPDTNSWNVVIIAIKQ